MKSFFFFIILFSLMSCSSQRVGQEMKCPEIYKKDFTNIVHEKYWTSNGEKTVFYNEIRFECVYSPFYTHKVMYDRFGKWDKEIYPENKRYPFMVWDNVDLFSDGKKYKVITHGIEEWKHIYASVMVFDENGKDLLADSSSKKSLLTNFFADLIRNMDDDEGGDFYEAFWKTVDPYRWESLKKQRKK